MDGEEMEMEEDGGDRVGLQRGLQRGHVGDLLSSSGQLRSRLGLV